MLQILRRARSRPFNSLMLCKFEKSILHLHLQQSLCFYSSFANENANANENQKEEFHKFVSYLPPENNIGNINLIKHEETAVVSIENPSFMNAMTGKMMIELEEITNELSKWKTGKAVFLIGKNNQFCSGGDLKNFMNHLTTPSHGAMMSSYMHWVMRQFSLLEMTTVAIIEGQTLGGGAEIATACDYRIIADTARIGFVQTRLSISPGWGGATRLGRIIGARKATELLTSGRLLNAESALEMNLADDIFHEEEKDPLPWATDWLRKKGLLSSSPKVTQGVCKILKSDEDLEVSYRKERELFESVWQSEEHKMALSKNIKHK